MTSSSEWPLSDEEIRLMVAKYVASKPFLASSFIQKMEYQSVVLSFAYHYRLKTMTESRETYYLEVPWLKQVAQVDGPHNGPPPPIWDIVVRLPGAKKRNGSSLLRDPF